MKNSRTILRDNCYVLLETGKSLFWSHAFSSPGNDVIIVNSYDLVADPGEHIYLPLEVRDTWAIDARVIESIYNFHTKCYEFRNQCL